MCANQGDILRFAQKIAGDSVDGVLLSALCAAAASELERKLKSGVDAAALGETFTVAAGVLALSMYCAVSEPSEIRAFAAGDLSVTYGDGTSGAERLRAAAETLLAAYLEDQGFAFRGVPG